MLSVVKLMMTAHPCPASPTETLAVPVCGEAAQLSVAATPLSESGTQPASGPASTPPSTPPSAPASGPPSPEPPDPPPSIGLIGVDPFVYAPAQAQSEASARAAAEFLLMATSAAPGPRKGTRGSPRRGSSR